MLVERLTVNVVVRLLADELLVIVFVDRAVVVTMVVFTDPGVLDAADTVWIVEREPPRVTVLVVVPGLMLDETLGEVEDEV